ncbi:MAG: shikimate kinase [Verrucomicrobiales bacterium]|nr:shikimate kinase [Verrucomicrobiales bacterium]
MRSDRQIRNIALIGFMGAGKSTVGQAVARQLRFEFVDTDHLIEARAGMPISEIFAQQGEAAFRQIEQQVVTELAGRHHTVIATGGGVGANAEHLASLKKHALVVCLWVSPEVVWRRVRNQTHRPLLQVPDPQARIVQLLEERTPVYRQADVLMNSGLRQLTQVVQNVVHQYRIMTRAPRPE